MNPILIILHSDRQDNCVPILFRYLCTAHRRPDKTHRCDQLVECSCFQIQLILGKRMCMLRSGCEPSRCKVEPFFNMYMKNYKEYGQCTKNAACKSNVCKVGYCCKQQVNDACLMRRLNQLPPYHDPLKTPTYLGK